MVFSFFKKHKLILIFTLIVAIFYSYKLSDIPSSLYADETTVGYNAYSILKTGKDEYGVELPLLFRLFGAYTPPLFVYTLLGSISIFGLNAFSLRIVSVLSTLGLILVIYFLSKSLKLFTNSSPWLVTLVFATAPWVFFNARIGYEVTLGYFLFYLGVLLLWQDFKASKLSFFGLFFLSLSTYTAHTERYLVPLFFVFFLSVSWKKLFRKDERSSTLKKIFLVALTQVPHFYLLFTPSFWVKNQSFASGSLSSGFWDFINQLLVYYSPQTYYGTPVPDINLQHFIPEISLFYSWQILPFLVGLFYILKMKTSPDKKLLLFLLLASPIPGAFSGHFVSVQRVLPIIVPVVIVVALGLGQILRQVPKQFTKLSYVFLGLITFVSLILLWRSYFVLLPGQRAVWWNYGAKEIAQFIKENPNEKIVIDNTRDQALYSPIIFYLQQDPQEFQKQFTEIKARYYQNPAFSSTVNIGSAITRSINWETDPLNTSYLISDPLGISDDQAKEHFLKKIKEIKDQTGKVHYQIFKTDPQSKQQSNAKAKEKL